MQFITIEDINHRLDKYPHVKMRHEISRLELPPEEHFTDDEDDTWPCITAILKDGERRLLWTIFARGHLYNKVVNVLEEFNKTLGNRPPVNWRDE